MSHSLHVVGFVPPDQQFRDKLAAYQACKAAKIAIPDELLEFFGDEPPDPKGQQIELAWGDHIEKPGKPCVTPYRAEMVTGFDIDLSKLPESVKTLRVFISY